MPDRRAVRGTVLLVGPDGSGKSTLVAAIERLAVDAGVSVGRAHHRPGLFFGGGQGGTVPEPHSAPPRPLLLAISKLLVVFADHVIGGWLRWEPIRSSGLLLLERGWQDMVVDPRRYRLPVKAVPVVRLLARLLPRPDLVVVLTGDPSELHRRKPEIGVAEVDRQMKAWRGLARSTGRRSLEVDTVTVEADRAAEQILDTLAASSPGDRYDGPWRRVRLTPTRLEMCATGRATPAMSVYQPQSRRARAGALAARCVVSRTGPIVPPPVSGLHELWELLDLHPDGVVAMRSSTAARHVLAVCRSGRMEAVVKIGGADDGALRHEAEMLAASIDPSVGVRRPEVLWAGEWRASRFVLATRAVVRTRDDGWSADEVVAVIQALSMAGPGGTPLTHGDLAPWNMLRTAEGTVLLDWESARLSDEPLHDLAHFVVAEGALLGRYDPAGALSLLCGPESPGERLLRLRGRHASESRALLVDYLAMATPSEPRAIHFTSEMLRLVTGTGLERPSPAAR